jgi:hypothetical protein
MMAETFSAGDVWAAAGSFVVVVGSLLVLVQMRDPKKIDPFDRKNSHHWDLALWERDRLQGIAKGLAGAAVAFLSAVFGAVLQASISAAVPPIWIVGCLLGVAGSLLIVLAFYRSADRWARTYYSK